MINTTIIGNPKYVCIYFNIPNQCHKKLHMQGDAIYAEIPPDVIPILKPQLREKLIIFIGKFVVEKAKPGYKVVHNPYMLRLNRRTTIATSNANDLDFPKYMFSLTPIEILPQFVKNKERFLGIFSFHHQ